MRKILSLSLPPSDMQKVKALSKKRGYNTMSSYIKHLIEEDEHLISETELLKDLRTSKKEYKKKKTIKAESLADVL